MVEVTDTVQTHVSSMFLLVKLK